MPGAFYWAAWTLQTKHGAMPGDWSLPLLQAEQTVCRCTRCPAHRRGPPAGQVSSLAGQRLRAASVNPVPACPLHACTSILAPAMGVGMRCNSTSRAMHAPSFWRHSSEQRFTLMTVRPPLDMTASQICLVVLHAQKTAWVRCRGVWVAGSRSPSMMKVVSITDTPAAEAAACSCGASTSPVPADDERSIEQLSS